MEILELIVHAWDQVIFNVIHSVVKVNNGLRNMNGDGLIRYSIDLRDCPSDDRCITVVTG